MPKKTTTRSKALATTAQPTRDVTHMMTGSTDLVRVDAVYHVPSVHPAGPGPWAQEADKIAWTDEMSGYGCIIRRSPTEESHLCGYVSVPPGHPLFGRRHGNLDDLLIGVHGGLDYSAACQAREPEDRSVCHPGGRISRERIVPEGFLQNVQMNDVAARQIGSTHDAWWFGFSCNTVGDITPKTRPGTRSDQLLDGVNHPSYKTEAFVYQQCVRLAAQLKAIEEGRDPRDADPGPPAAAYNPNKTGG